MNEYTLRGPDGGYWTGRGIDAPVLGLAIVREPCDCGCRGICAVVHVRSGHSLFHSSSAENFGKVWEHLCGADWTRSAAELESDGLAALALESALETVPDGYRAPPSETRDDIPDIPGYGENEE